MKEEDVIPLLEKMKEDLALVKVKPNEEQIE